MSRCGLAVRRLAGKRKDLCSIPLRLSFLFKSCGLWTLSCDFVPHNYETLKWLSSLPTHRYIISLSLPPPSILPAPPPPPPSPCLISFMVSVDVKHHVYLLTYSTYFQPTSDDINDHLKKKKIYIYIYTIGSPMPFSSLSLLHLHSNIYIYITDKNLSKTTNWHKEIFGSRLPRGFILNN